MLSIMGFFFSAENKVCVLQSFHSNIYAYFTSCAVIICTWKCLKFITQSIGNNWDLFHYFLFMTFNAWNLTQYCQSWASSSELITKCGSCILFVPTFIHMTLNAWNITQYCQSWASPSEPITKCVSCILFVPTFIHILHPALWLSELGNAWNLLLNL